MYKCCKNNIILMAKKVKAIFPQENKLKGDWNSRLTLYKEFQ